MKKLMCDVDGILLDMTKCFGDYIKKINPDIVLYPEKWDYGIDYDTIHRYLDQYWESDDFLVKGMDFFPNAKENINKIAKFLELNIVTALPKKYKDQRVRNLKGVNYHDLQVIGGEKIDYILNILKPDVAFEDKPEYIIRMASAGTDVYFPNIPLTQGIGPEIATPYNDWNHLFEMVNEKYN